MLDFIIQGLLELFPKSVQWLITAVLVAFLLAILGMFGNYIDDSRAVLVAFLLAILGYAWSQGLLG